VVDPPLQAATAVAFGLLTLAHGAQVQRLGVYSLYAAVLLALLFVDLRTRYVYDAMVYPSIALAVVLTPLVRSGPLAETWWVGLGGALLGAAVFGAFYLLGRALYQGVTAMGVGDISLAALLGAVVGLDRTLVGLFIASIVGGALALLYLALKQGRHATMPYGPALCLGALALLIGGG
jgi:prepilin signal peptidase PulO-like enzyme (type II secretory pathway)